MDELHSRFERFGELKNILTVAEKKLLHGKLRGYTVHQ